MSGVLHVCLLLPSSFIQIVELVIIYVVASACLYFHLTQTVAYLQARQKIMEIDNLFAMALATAKVFWSETGRYSKPQMTYMLALLTALEAMGTEHDHEVEADTQDEWLLQMHTLVVVAYSQHNAAVAVTHYGEFVKKTLYHYWQKLDKYQSSFAQRARRATNENPGIALMTLDQEPRRKLCDTAWKVTDQFYGRMSNESLQGEQFWVAQSVVP
jgi:hypothetical protein